MTFPVSRETLNFLPRQATTSSKTVKLCHPYPEHDQDMTEVVNGVRDYENQLTINKTVISHDQSSERVVDPRHRVKLHETKITFRFISTFASRSPLECLFGLNAAMGRVSNDYTTTVTSTN